MTEGHMLGLAKTGALRVVVLTAVGAIFAAACGGGGMTDSAGSGGSASGGSATGSGGNSTGSGGNSTGSGGSSGDGGATSGGASSTGGNDGEGGLGGGEGNDAECPETMPGPEEACEGGFMAPTCTYGDQECECQGFGQNATWECAEAMEEEECPADAPEDGDACTTQQFCQFGGDNCVCDGEEWNCF